MARELTDMTQQANIFFDKEAFIGGKKTIYINPRTLINNTAPYPIEGGTILGLDFMFILII